MFQDCTEKAGELNRNGSHYFLKNPPELFPASKSTGRVPQPSKALRDGEYGPYPQRPLPELPTERPSSLSRRSSVASATPSITSSLLQYIEEELLNPDEVEVGVAQLVHLAPSESSPSLVPDEEPKSMLPADCSFSDYDISPQSTNDSLSDGIFSLPPENYLPTTGSSLERGLALFSSPEHPAGTRPLESRQSLPATHPWERDVLQLEKVTLVESERESRSPSPAQKRAAKNALRRECSSQPDKPRGRSFFSGFRRKRMSGSPRKLAGMIRSRERPKPLAGTEGVGDWV